MGKVLRKPAPFHKTDKGMRYCQDFAMPIGTRLVAVEDGVILDRETRYSKNYENPEFAGRCNWVDVLHNGYISHYAHLKWRGILFGVGEKVKKNQVFAYSGNTGYAGYPHLHFGVYDLESKNIKFTLYSKTT